MIIYKIDYKVKSKHKTCGILFCSYNSIVIKVQLKDLTLYVLSLRSHPTN
jgi:hypothetical protein